MGGKDLDPHGRLRAVQGRMGSNKTIIPHALVGYEMIIANSALRALLATTISYPKRRIIVKRVSMRKPGRTRQGVIKLKSPISLKLGKNVRYQELAYVTECQVKILNSLGDPGSP